MTPDQEQEYKASHILVETEEKAGEIIEKLNEGADFGELAKEHSKDTSATQGGDLGWFTPEVMVEPFSQAVTQLKEGEYTRQPVQTQFGWHVIRLEEVREATPPSIEEVRPQIVQRLQSQMISDYLEKLREQAEVEIRVE
jgi:peptidyl-prolyl cis-trans isomerase C